MRMRIGCLCGDLPCNKVCLSRWCPYNTDGHCEDNDVCENRSTEDGYEFTEREGRAPARPQWGEIGRDGKDGRAGARPSRVCDEVTRREDEP